VVRAGFRGPVPALRHRGAKDTARRHPAARAPVRPPVPVLGIPPPQHSARITPRTAGRFEQMFGAACASPRVSPIAQGITHAELVERMGQRSGLLVRIATR